MPLNSPLKCTVQWVLVCSHGGVTFPLSNFIIPPKKPIPPGITPHSHTPPPLAITHVLSVSMDLPLSDISYKWNTTLSVLLYLASFP